MTSPIALAFSPLPGHDPADPATLAHTRVLVDTLPHPDLVALLAHAGATRRGRATWSYHPGDLGDHTPLARLLTSDFKSHVMPAGATVNDQGRPVRIERHAWRTETILDTLSNVLAHTPGGRRVVTDARPVSYYDGWHFGGGDRIDAAVIAVSADDRRTVWLRVHTHRFTLKPDDPYVGICGIDKPLGNLDLRPAGRNPKDGKVVTGYDAVRLAQWAIHEAFPVCDHDHFTPQLSGRDVVRFVAESLHRSGGQDAVLADHSLVLAARRLRSPHKLLGVDKDRYAATVATLTSVAAQLRENAANSCVILPVAGQPAVAVATVGRNSKARTLFGKALTRADNAPGLPGVQLTPTAAKVTKAAALPASQAYVDSQLTDVAAMAEAPDYPDANLRAYQRTIVGRHLATSRGFVNCIEPGMGKTVTTLTAWSVRAAATPGWRGLAIVEANVRSQWADEAAIWFPDARVVVVTSRAERAEVAQLLATAGDDPVLVVTSYALIATVSDVVDAQRDHRRAVSAARVAKARSRASRRDRFATVEDTVHTVAVAAQAAVDVLDTEAAVPSPDEHLGALLLTLTFDDLAADEVVGLRNTAAKAGKALWALRAQADVAVALTGTPITRGLDDLASLICWARGDRRLFTGALLSDEFDLTSASELKRLTRAVGPLLIRYDKSEIAGELPTVASEVVTLVPTDAERKLAHAARDELKAAYEELVAALDMARTADPDDPELAEIAGQVRVLKGAWLGGTTLARMAASDPVALQGSQTAASALLDSQGLITAAVADGGTKRAWARDYVLAEAAQGRRCLLFTEFQTVARLLIDELRDAGLSVGEILGGGGKRRDEFVAAFQRGELDVVVATKAGERGLNLQVADTVMHLDLPWTPDGVVQRTGRVERIGSASSKVKIVFSVMGSTIEDRIAALVVARSLTSMQALDASRGKRADATEMGRALIGLAGTVDPAVSGLKGRDAQLLEMTRSLLAA